MVNKTGVIMEHLLDRDPSIVFISETWLQSDANNVTSLVKDYGYKLLHNRRRNRQKNLGGGVGVLLKQSLDYKHMKYKQYSSFELTVVKIFLTNKKSLTLVCLYRVLFVSITVFLYEIIQLFEILVSSNENIILAGDANVHMDEDNLYSNQFKDILNTFNAIQHVNFPTHIAGHTLDIIITFDNNSCISNIKSSQYDISHHFLVEFDVAVSPNKREYKTIYYRNLKAIDSVSFQQDISSKLSISATTTLAINAKSYNEVMTGVLNDHAPMKSKTIKIVPNAPWFDCEYEHLRKLRRKAEKTYRRSGLDADKENYKKLRKQTTDLAYAKKRKFYSDKLEESSNSKSMYSAINKLLDKKQETSLPDAKSDKELADDFLNYFIEKIEKIRLKFHPGICDDNVISDTDVKDKLSAFEVATTDEIKQIVLSYGVKCSPDDPIPSVLLKTNLDFFIPIWTRLVNISLAEGSMECMKSAVLLPLIKELDEMIDKDNMKNYRPVSNLLFIGKLVERVVSTRLKKHLDDNNLNISSQYGYKKGHSTETLLINVVNDLLIACDEQMPTIVMLLDLSAAFDTIDQDKLLSILHDEIGINGIALKWFASFLKGRSQKVKIRNAFSAEKDLDYGLPQGSVLGPDLFNIYTRSFHKYMVKSWFNIFGFADDQQLMKSFLPFLQVMALSKDITYCFEMISRWMQEFFLCLNPNKTKILLVVPPSLKDKIVINGIFINNNCVRFVHSAKNLGVILDDTLSFRDQILSTVKSCFNVIRNLSKIKDFLSYDQLRTVISACIFSRLDYCNSLYYGAHSYLLDKLQSVQNSAARLLLRKGGLTNLRSTSTCIRRHHWLRIRDRIIFKICLLVHKCLHGIAPSSLSSLLTNCSSSRTMKLANITYKSGFGNRSFSRVGPKMWNLLPIHLRMEKNCIKFKTGLKTYLFDNSDSFYQKLHEC